MPQLSLQLSFPIRKHPWGKFSIEGIRKLDIELSEQRVRNEKGPWHSIRLCLLIRNYLQGRAHLLKSSALSGSKS